MMKATTSHPPTSLVEPSFFKRPQRSSNVVVRARVLGAHGLCQRPLEGRLRPGGVPLRARKESAKTWGEFRYQRAIQTTR
jgi:hypothetical protein